MRDVKELCAIVEEEIGKIADKGLTTGNLETAYKLIDIYKDIKSTEYWDRKGEYYDEMLSQMREGGYSEAMSGGSYASGNSGNGGSYNSGRNRYSGGHYSRDGGSGNSGNSYDGGSSGRRSHYVRGHYSRSSGNSGGDPYDDYMSEKQSYRSSGKNEDCKQRMLAALEEHMDELTQEIGDMAKDADCGEERQVLSRYIDKLKRMM